MWIKAKKKENKKCNNKYLLLLAVDIQNGIRVVEARNCLWNTIKKKISSLEFNNLKFGKY